MNALSGLKQVLVSEKKTPLFIHIPLGCKYLVATNLDIQSTHTHNENFVKNHE